MAGGWAGRGVGLPGRRCRRLDHHGNRHLRRETPRSQAARHGRRPCVRQAARGETRAGRDAGPRQRQHRGEHHRLGLEGAPGRQDLPRSQDSGALSISRAVSTCRTRWGSWSVRPTGSSTPTASSTTSTRFPRSTRHSTGRCRRRSRRRRTTFHKPEDDLPHQVRRPPMDERLHRRLHPSLLLGDEHGREVHDLGPRPGDLRDHRLAGEAGDADGLGHGWRQRHEDPGLQVRASPPRK